MNEFFYKLMPLPKKIPKLKWLLCLDLETMSTSQGKKLLVSGYWGLVRHPNYIGDILMHLAIGAICFTSPCALGALPSTILLIHRASRIDARCKRQYGSYWDKYCQKVKYQLIPKIYWIIIHFVTQKLCLNFSTF